MATTNQCIASLARLSLSNAARPSTTPLPRFLLPSVPQLQVRNASNRASSRSALALKAQRERRKKTHKSFRVHKLDDMEQFSLCDAIRYARAVEVGRPPMSVKYNLAIKLKTLKSGAVIRDRIRLPHPVKTDVRIAVVCKEDSPVAQEARAAGAVAVGEESLFQAIRDDKMNFNRLICHNDSQVALSKAQLGRILGPKGMMPSVKTKTITGNVVRMMRELVGADNYRERDGAIRMAIGQLGFTPEMLSENVKAFMGQIKKDIAALEDTANKELYEVVLSTTNGPGYSLNGGFNSTDPAVTPASLGGPM